MTMLLIILDVRGVLIAGYPYGDDLMVAAKVAQFCANLHDYAKKVKLMRMASICRRSALALFRQSAFLVACVVRIVS